MIYITELEDLAWVQCIHCIGPIVMATHDQSVIINGPNALETFDPIFAHNSKPFLKLEMYVRQGSPEQKTKFSVLLHS